MEKIIIGVIFAINMFLNASWIPIFVLNSTLGYVLGNVIIVGMLATTLYASMKAVEAG